MGTGAEKLFPGGFSAVVYLSISLLCIKYFFIPVLKDDQIISMFSVKVSYYKFRANTLHCGGPKRPGPIPTGCEK